MNSITFINSTTRKEIIMKKIVLSAVVTLAMVLTGCTSVNTNDAARDFNATIKPAEFQTIIEAGDTKVNGEAQLNVLFGIFSWGVSEFADRAFESEYDDMPVVSLFSSPLTLVKDAAAYNACNTNKCDVILNAKYHIKTTDYFVFKIYNCKVSGYPGVEKGLKPVK